MIQCPGCGSNVRFDIATQRLVCEGCQADYDPYEFDQKQMNVEETSEYDPELEYEVTIYTCPQCGGEIVSTDQEAAVFCSYCGASHVLPSRLGRIKKPAFILPFTKTKADCKDAYSKWMKSAVFAPKELKDPEYIDSFRGIYMPYWVYDIRQQGKVVFTSSKTYRLGDFVIRDEYETDVMIDNSYDGLSSDASSSYADSISETIAPYEIKKVKKFSPSFLSGFYADTADVPAEVYQNAAVDVARNETAQKIKRTQGIPIGSAFKYPLKAAIPSEVTNTQAAMFPVWFLSYRKGDRIAYAAINGQTGKISADLPVDQKKYIVSSLLLAIPIFAFLFLFFTIRPAATLVISAMLAAVSLVLYAIEQNNIHRMDEGLDDKGKMSLVRKSKKNPNGTIPSESMERYQQVMAENQNGTSDDHVKTFEEMQKEIYEKKNADDRFVTLTDGAQYGERPKRKVTKSQNGLTGSRGFILGLFSIIVAILVLIINPVSDLWYFLGAIFSLGAEIALILEIIRSYNLTATRPLPQFERSGGDDRA